jgi:hypothetical protein
MATNPKKIPTIGNLLDSMPPEGIEDQVGQFKAYAALGYHWDGIDRRDFTARKIRTFISNLDSWTADQLPGFSVELLDEDDRVGLLVSWEHSDTDALFFRCPTLSETIKPDQNVPRYLRALIDKLGSPEMYELPYLAIGDLIRQAMVASGFL